ncbi:uncharacterized protein LOC122854653 [Aphidius gifuensis]|nr:uncharacterized protein LOC122854653 [Aphidius gifuensis]
MIFSHLKINDRLQMEKVCEKWKAGCQLMWKNISTFATGDKKFNVQYGLNRQPNDDDVKNALIKCGEYLNHASFSLSENPTILSAITDYCCNLVSLELILHANANVNDFTDAFKKMIKLRSINILFVNNDRKNNYADEVEDETPHNDEKILQSLPIDMENISLISDELRWSKYPDEYCDDENEVSQFVKILNKFNSLRSLTLSNYEIGENVMDIICLKGSLAYLDLSKSKLNGPNPAISNLINLEHLDLSFVGDYIDDNVVIEIINSCKYLKYFDLSMCGEITKASLIKLEKLKNIQVLLLNEVYDVDDDIVNSLVNLKKFGCSKCDGVTDVSAMKIIQNSPGLESLILYYTEITTKTLQYASEVLKKRDNGVKLIVYTSCDVIKSFDKTDTSSLLDVQRYNDPNGFDTDNY